jgi:hypothetical protein
MRAGSHVRRPVFETVIGTGISCDVWSRRGALPDDAKFSG